MANKENHHFNEKCTLAQLNLKYVRIYYSVVLLPLLLKAHHFLVVLNFLHQFLREIKYLPSILTYLAKCHFQLSDFQKFSLTWTISRVLIK